MIQIKEIFNECDWHPEAILPNVPFQQAFWYGEMQKQRGRSVRRFILAQDGVPVLYAQFVVYPLIGTMKYWYSAYGPVVKGISEEILSEMKARISDLIKSSDTIFARFDFSPALSPELAKSARKIFTKASKSSSSGSYFQPRNEWYTDISKSAEEILTAMHQKTRYSVRYAEKKGIKTEIISGSKMLEHLPQFLMLMQDTAKRNKFSLHDKNYYKCFFEEVAKRSNGFIIEAKLGDEVLASHLVLLEGNIAHYAFGGTSDAQKELCAPYLAHYSAMLEAKKKGAVAYNFGGISGAGEAKHWAGVTAFKKRFAGQAVSHGAYFDIVAHSFWYYLYVLRKFLKSFV